MEAANTYLEELLNLLEIERCEEMDQLEKDLKDKSMSIRKVEGLTWFPVKAVDQSYALGSRPLLTVERNPNDSHAVLFQNGSPVIVFSADGEESVKGFCYSVNDRQLSIVLFSEDIPDWIDQEKLGVNYSIDSRSFVTMKKALKEVLAVDHGPLYHIKSMLFGIDKIDHKQVEQSSTVESLNDSQQDALDQVLTSPIALIHGPPGTGKSTVLAAATQQLVERGERVLLCAPSNAAVDHLLRKVSEFYPRVIRIGNPARLDERSLGHTLESRMRDLPDYKRVTQYKRAAFEERKAAEKFKRNFGPEERQQRRKHYAESRQLLRESKDLEAYLAEKIISQCQVVCTTLVGSESSYLEHVLFDAVIIDEAAQALEPAAWIPLRKGKKVVLAGDPFQLPPTIKAVELQDSSLRVSLLERCIQSGLPSSLLKTQYRMNTEIMAYSNQWFYNGQLEAHESNKSELLPGESLAIEFIDTAGTGYSEESHEGQLSKFNPGEVGVLLQRLDAFEANSFLDAAVISPYKDQVTLLRERLGTRKGLRIDTVDSFQGQESDLVIMSLVRSNEQGAIGFLSDYRRMNVAMTRAKRKLIVIGDSATIGNDPFYQGFLNFCEEKNFYRSAWEFMME